MSASSRPNALTTKIRVYSLKDVMITANDVNDQIIASIDCCGNTYGKSMVEKMHRGFASNQICKRAGRQNLRWENAEISSIK